MLIKIFKKQVYIGRKKIIILISILVFTSLCFAALILVQRSITSDSTENKVPLEDKSKEGEFEFSEEDRLSMCQLSVDNSVMYLYNLQEEASMLGKQVKEVEKQIIELSSEDYLQEIIDQFPNYSYGELEEIQNLEQQPRPDDLESCTSLIEDYENLITSSEQINEVIRDMITYLQSGLIQLLPEEDYDDWLLYENEKHGFSMYIPPSSNVWEQDERNLVFYIEGLENFDIGIYDKCQNTSESIDTVSTSECVNLIYHNAEWLPSYNIDNNDTVHLFEDMNEFNNIAPMDHYYLIQNSKLFHIRIVHEEEWNGNRTTQDKILKSISFK